MEQQPKENSSVQEKEGKQEKSSVFRRRSIERISSPEQLNDYIRVASPRMWAVLIAVIAFLLGGIIWSAIGTIYSKVYGVAIVEDGRCRLYFSEEKAMLVDEGDPVQIGKKETKIGEFQFEPIVLTSSFPEYARSLGGFALGEWLYEATADTGDLPDGMYKASVTEETLSPFSFLTDRQ